MIICTECGATNGDDDQFCGSCGEFLRWDTDATGVSTRARTQTTRRADTGDATRVTAGDATRVTAGDATRVTAGDATRVTAGDATRADVDDATAGDAPHVDRGAVLPPPEGTDDRPRPDRTTPDRARTKHADGSPQPAQPQPQPVQPGPPTPRPAPGPAPAPVAPVDLPPRPPEPRVACPACDTSNAPGRRFCRACGAELVAPAPPAPPRSWWQRLWDRVRRRTPRRRSLRDEPGTVKAAQAARRTLLVVLALCLAGVLAVVGPPLARRAVEAVRDRTEDPAPLVPAAVTASSEAPGAGAARLTDGANNRYWAPNGQAVDAWVEGQFTEPVRLLTVVITPGVGPRRQAFLAAGRPRGLTVVAIDTRGERHETDIELRDEPGAQYFTVKASDVVRIRLVVRSTYGPGLVPSVAIGEAEFFGRR